MPAAPLWLYGAVGGLILMAAGGWWIYERGVEVERGRAATVALEKIETDRKDREKSDETARNLGDDAALRCLRNPAGCR